MRDFWTDFSGALGGTKDLRTGQVLDGLNDLLGPHVFPARADGGDPRQCPSCGKGQLSLKLGKFGAFIGCSNYPECKFTRVLSPTGQNGDGAAEGERPGVRALALDPQTGDEITLRSGRFGDYVQRGEGEKPKRCSLPKGLSPDDVTLEKAIALLSLPREVARHPTSGEPILAGVGRYGSYVQHGKTYANLGRDDDVLEIGANRAIDLIVAKESGAGRGRFGADLGRVLGDHPTLGGAVTVKQGRFGVYVNHGKVNATLPKGSDPTTPDARRGGRLARRQGGGRRRRRRARARRSSRRRADRRARRALRRLRQLGQGQRHDPQIDFAGENYARPSDRADRGTRRPSGRRERPKKRQAQDRQAERQEGARQESGRGQGAGAKRSARQDGRDPAGRGEGQDRDREDQAKGLNAARTRGDDRRLARRGHSA